MRHGSLFSGIGGFDLAAEWMGWENVFHCEKEKFCQQVLNYYWPKATLHEDIRNTDFTIYRDRIDILTGGFPCQPYSQAGKRLGKEDDRHLWPEMLRAVREISPRWIVGENVRGLINWNGGLVFDEVQADLEAEGYEVIPFLLPACAVNAPHRRDRIWFVAYSDVERSQKRIGRGFETDSEKTGERIHNRIERPGHNGTTPDPYGCGHRNENRLGKDRCPEETRDGEKQRENREWVRGIDRGTVSERIITNSNIAGRKECHIAEIADRSEQRSRHAIADWTQWPTQFPVCSGNDGVPPPNGRNYRFKAQKRKPQRIWKCHCAEGSLSDF